MLDWIVLALLAVPVLLVIAVAAVAIVCEDGRPVFFRQVRIGLRGRPFVMLKLRTMATSAAPESEVPDTARITRVGRVLRRLSIDELPQFLNVAKGEMSLVGPRPHLPDRAQRYCSREMGRLAVLPGLTGWAQTVGRNRIDWVVRTEHDLMYAATQSLRLDLHIILRSCRVVLSGDGLYGHPRHGSSGARSRLADSVNLAHRGRVPLRGNHMQPGSASEVGGARSADLDAIEPAGTGQQESARTLDLACD